MQKNEKAKGDIVNYENRMRESKYEKTHLKLTMLVQKKYCFLFDICLECQLHFTHQGYFNGDAIIWLA